MQLLKTKVTSLELTTPPADDVQPPEGAGTVSVEEVPGIPVEEYRFLYDAVGRPHHWTSRHVPDPRLAAEIHAEGTRIHVMTVDGERAGWFELDARRAIGETRIVHFAILPKFRGRGLAPFLLSRAIRAGFADGPKRLTLETNTLDHPAALPLYRKFGFQPVGTREVVTPAINPDE